MRPEIVSFCKDVCSRYNLRANYIPDAYGHNDVWSIVTKQGYMIMNFTTEIFYDIPPRARMRQFLPAIKRGLNAVLGEKHIQNNGQMRMYRRVGKIVV